MVNYLDFHSDCGLPRVAVHLYAGLAPLAHEDAAVCRSLAAHAVHRLAVVLVELRGEVVDPTAAEPPVPEPAVVVDVVVEPSVPVPAVVVVEN